MTVLYSSLILAANGPAIPDYKADKIAENAWVIHGPLEQPNVKNQGFMNNPGYILTDKGVVIIDPGSSLQAGEMVLRVLRNISKKPVVAVFNTHIHGDHWLGNQAIKNAYPEVKIFGHPAMIRAVEAGEGLSWLGIMDSMTEGATKGTNVTPPTIPVVHGDVITVNNKRFKIHHYAHSHTKTDIMIEVIEDKIVFLGDNVLAKRMARMTDGNFKGNINALDEILKTNAKTWVPGHGKTGNSSVVTNFNNYLKAVYATAKKGFDNDVESSDIKALVLKATESYKDWASYDHEIGRHAGQAYLEVEATEF